MSVRPWTQGPFRGGSLRGVLTRLVLLVALIVTALVGVAMAGTVITARDYREAAELALEREEAANQVLVDLLNAETGNRGYTLTGGGTYLQPYLGARRRYEQDIHGLKRSVSGISTLEQAVDEVQRTADLWFQEARELIRLRRTPGQGREAATARLAEGVAQDRFQAFRAAHDQLLTGVEDERVEAFRLTDRRRQITVTGAAIAGLIALLVAALAARQLWRRVGGPVSAISAGVNRVTRGRLSDPVPTSRTAVRELAELVDGFNDMQRQVSQQREAIAAAARREAGQSTERRLWETVQAGLLPDRLPSPVGLNVAARYQPAEKALLLGGDFYDSVRLSDGRVALMVGDMAGHGAAAAARATGLRFAWRTLVSADPDPGVVTRALNVQATSPVERAEGLFASLLYAVVSPNGTVEYAPAGHPPPVILSASGCEVHEPDAWGPLLGVVDHATWPVTRLRLDEGSTMVLYTDGLVEARAGADLFGTERVCEILAAERRSAIELRVERLVDAARRHRSFHLEDDIVVLAVERVLPVAQGPRRPLGSGRLDVERPREPVG